MLVLQRILIDPEYFRPVKVSVEDLDEDMSVSVNYGAFKQFSEKNFPEKIVFQLAVGNKIFENRFRRTFGTEF